MINSPIPETMLAYTVADVCRLCRQSRTSIYAAMGRGELVARKRGRRTVVLLADLRRWLDGLPHFAPRARGEGGVR
jgi:hypothetical protein